MQLFYVMFLRLKFLSCVLTEIIIYLNIYSKYYYIKVKFIYLHFMKSYSFLQISYKFINKKRENHKQKKRSFFRKEKKK